MMYQIKSDTVMVIIRNMGWAGHRGTVWKQTDACGVEDDGDTPFKKPNQEMK
jgi:hypothetical protein